MNPNIAPYVEAIEVVGIGGGEDATIITLKGGRAIVLAFGIVGIYSSVEAYWEGEETPVWMSEDDFCEQ